MPTTLAEQQTDPEIRPSQLRPGPVWASFEPFRMAAATSALCARRTARSRIAQGNWAETGSWASRDSKVLGAEEEYRLIRSNWRRRSAGNFAVPVSHRHDALDGQQTPRTAIRQEEASAVTLAVCRARTMLAHIRLVRGQAENTTEGMQPARELMLL